MALETWGTPTSGASVALGGAASGSGLTYAGTYWLSYVRAGANTVAPTIRYAVNPNGTWGTVTLPAAPSGYTNAFSVGVGGDMVGYLGGTYAMVISYYGATASPQFTWQIAYTTDPTGSWSLYDLDNDITTSAAPTMLAAFDNRWYVAGRWNTAGTANPAFIAYTGAGSAPNSTWSYGTAASVTGYNPADIPAGGQLWRILDMVKYGANVVTLAQDATGVGSTDHFLRYTDQIPSGTWGTPTTASLPEQASNFAVGASALGAASLVNLYFASDPTGTWGSVGTADHKLTTRARGLAYGNGYWVASGLGNGTAVDPVISYIATTGTPSGAWSTAVSTGFTDSGTSSEIRWVRYSGGYFVAQSDYNGELRWAYVDSPVTGNTFLRLHQSPVMTPSRPRGPYLRQRQRPNLT